MPELITPAINQIGGWPLRIDLRKIRKAREWGIKTFQ